MLKFMDDYPAKYYAIRDNLFLTHLFLIWRQLLKMY
jgi:hypothetical protein